LNPPDYLRAVPPNRNQEKATDLDSHLKLRYHGHLDFGLRIERLFAYLHIYGFEIIVASSATQSGLFLARILFHRFKDHNKFGNMLLPYYVGEILG
jgi:hypothetical protein